MVLDLYTHLKHILKYEKQNYLINSRIIRKIDKSIIIQGDFHMPFLIVDMDKKKISKDTERLDMTNKLDLNTQSTQIKTLLVFSLVLGKNTYLGS